MVVVLGDVSGSVLVDGVVMISEVVIVDGVSVSLVVVELSESELVDDVVIVSVVVLGSVEGLVSISVVVLGSVEGLVSISVVVDSVEMLEEVSGSEVVEVTSDVVISGSVLVVVD